MKTDTYMRILTMLLFFVLGIGLAQAQISYRVGYDNTTQTYRVYMRSSQTFTGNNARLATAQITLLFPHATGTGAFSLTNLQGKRVMKGTQEIEMVWNTSSRADAPRENPSNDIQSFGYTNASGLQFDIMAGQEIELFSFQANNGCTGPVRLIDNSEPFAANVPNSVGATAGNAIYIQGVRGVNSYAGNYGTVASCGNTTRPDVGVTLSGPAALTAGTSASYVLSLTNVGTAATTGSLTSSLSLAAGLSYTNFSGSNWMVISQVVGGVTVLNATYTGTLAANGGMAPSLTLNLAAGNVIGSTGIAGVLTATNDINLVNNVVSQSIALVAPPQTGNPALLISYIGATSITVGTQSSFTVNITNTGTGTTTGPVTTTLSLPVGVAYNGFLGAGWNVIAAVQANGTTLLTATYAATLAAGVSVVVPVVINVTPAQAIVSSAVVISGGVTTVNNVIVVGNSFNVTINIRPVPVTGAPVLFISYGGSLSFTVGVQSSFSINVSNTGTAATTGPVTTTLSLPVGVAYTGYVGAGWSVVSALQINGTTLVTATYNATIGAGIALIPLIINVTPAPSIVVTSAVLLIGAVTINNQITIINTVNITINIIAGQTGTSVDLAAVLLGPGMSAPGSVTLLPGQPTNLTLLVTNALNTSATVSPTTQTTLPAGLTLNSLSGTGWVLSSTLISGQTVVTATYTGVIAAGGRLPAVVLNVTAANSQTVTINLPVIGVLTVAGDVNLANNLFVLPIYVPCVLPNKNLITLVTSVSVTNRIPTQFQPTTISIVVSNTSTFTAYGVVSMVPLPVGYPVVGQLIAVNTTFNVSTGQWTIGTLLPGQSVTLNITLSAAVSGIATIINSVTATNQVGLVVAQSCFSVPVQLCPGGSLIVSVPASITGVQWFRDGGTTPIATGNSLTVTQTGVYTLRAAGYCTAGDCCPLVVLPSTDCCPASVCIPFTMRKTR